MMAGVVGRIWQQLAVWTSVLRFEHIGALSGFAVRAEIPGVDPGRDVRIWRLGNVLRVEVTRAPTRQDQIRSEFHYGRSAGTVEVPADVDARRLSAAYHRGVLTISEALRDPVGSPVAIIDRASAVGLGRGSKENVMPRVVVGLAERSSTDRTLEWAVAEAAVSGASLVIVRAEIRRPDVLTAVARGAGAELREADPVLARAMDNARTVLGDDRIGVAADRDAAGPVLVRAARTDDLVVVGAPTMSGWWNRGSTTYHVMTRALCPVVAVHDRAPATSGDTSGPSFDGQVVVGVDRSPAAHAALAFGFSYASKHGIPVVAATATRRPIEDVWFDDTLLETHLGSEPVEAARLAADVEPWHLKHPDVEVRRALIGDDAVAGLRRVSRDAALLVVGTAADRAAPLGRVSRSLVESAGCPVAVVRVEP